MSMQAWQWALAALGAVGIGLSKTGIPGLGILAIALFANAMPSRESVGVVLPILITADIFAVASYRRHGNWAHLLRLFPWTAAGVLIGWWMMDKLNNAEVAHLIGGVLIGLVLLQLWRRRAEERADDTLSTKPTYHSYAPAVGILGGFTTMVANAAGPVMVLYFLAMGLPKMEFIGTMAWYFFAVNLFKVPFSANLNLINHATLPIDLALLPACVAGALLGRLVLRRIDQKLFNNFALVLTLVAAIKLLF